MKKLVALVAALGLLLCGCNDKGTQDQSTDPTAQTGDPVVVTPQLDGADEEMFTDRDGRTGYDETSSVVIQLREDTASCSDAGVSVAGSTVTISREGTYILRGTLTDGQVVVDAGDQDKPQLVLDGASISSSDSAALYVREADKVFVTLADGSDNQLSSGDSFAETEEGIDGALYSKQDLTLNESGSLTVSAPAGHGIVCKDDLVITGGHYSVTSASHGLDANDSIRIGGADLSIDAGKDGIHAENAEDTTLGFVYLSGCDMKIEAEGDGISGAAYVQLVSGNVEVLAGGGYVNGEVHSSGGWGDFGGGGGMHGGGPGRRSAETTETDTTGEASTSMKGVKADGVVQIGGGMLTIDSADDGIHSNGSVMICGGTMDIASGDDGIHAETDLSVSDGVVRISHSYEGLEGLAIHVTGGEISLVATDDGFNAAGGTDSSGTGGRDQMFGGPGGKGGSGGMGGSSNGSIVIDGGNIYVQASGDGMDANGYLEIHGGHTVVCGPNSGDTATLDYDTSATIDGGIFIGTGASGMAQTFSDNAQGVLAVSVGQGQSAGVEITVSDGDGKELVSYRPELDFSVIIFSTPDMVSGETYHVTVGSLEGDLEAN